MRWALTPPFHPYQRNELPQNTGGLFSVALSIAMLTARVQGLPGSLPNGARTFLETNPSWRYSRDHPASTDLTTAI